LPRRSATPTLSNPTLAGLVPLSNLQSSKGGHQTLPLKSNLKKSGITGGNQKLQWHDPNDQEGLNISRGSPEELRV